MSLGNGADDSKGIRIIDNYLSISASSNHYSNFDRHIETSDLSVLSWLSCLVCGLPHFISEGKGIKYFQDSCKRSSNQPNISHIPYRSQFNTSTG